MKIEVAESFGYSYLRHVKKCLLVQTNWKYSDVWESYISDEELTRLSDEMKEKFGEDIFKKSGKKQSLKQGEMDIVGVDAQNNIYILESAFHEAGLSVKYAERILKKMLRSYLLVKHCFPAGWKATIGFMSPKVNPGQMPSLQSGFEKLREHYPQVNWELCINNDFSDRFEKTLTATKNNNDSSELFLRSVRLYEIARGNSTPRPRPPQPPNGQGRAPNDTPGQPGRLQPLIRKIMRVLLEENPLPDYMINKLKNKKLCQEELRFIIGFPIVINYEGQGIKRYWSKNVFGHADNRYLVCSEWWRDNHVHNAESLISFLETIRRECPDTARDEKLWKLETELREFINQ